MNSQQQKAVETVEGRLLVLAGAGSGKTRVLTYRIAHLISKVGIPPQAILGLTFTNKAAVEMRHRMETLISPKLARHVTLSTFHSFCLQILRMDIERLGYTTRFSLYNEHDVKRLMNYITRDILQCNGDLPSFARAESLIRQAKTRGDSPDQLIDTSSEWHQQYARTLYNHLDEAMRAHNAVDFDHLLTLCVQLFEQHPDLLDKYQEKYRYVMIDEYQDTNPIQYRLVSLLTQKYQNLCVVGDDDQSIYGWRGADMRNILDFTHATVIKLEQNYRSTNTILKAANAVISRNLERHQKVLWSDRGDGEPIEMLLLASEAAEAEAVAQRLVELREKNNMAWNEMAILYRSNSLARAFEIALTKQTWKEGEKWRIGIPYKVHGSTEFYEKREIKDLLAYLRFLLNPRDEEALLRIINYPRRGIGATTLDKLTAYHRLHKKALWPLILDICQDDSGTHPLADTFGGKVLEGVKEFIAIIDESYTHFSSDSLPKALEWLVQRIDCRRGIREEVKSEQMRAFKWENVQEFLQLAADFEKRPEVENEGPKDPLDHLAAFVSSFPLGGYSPDRNAHGEDKVQMMTFHSSKGLEFPACFLVGIEENIIPHERSIQENAIEEERRLMYVAITRARSKLTMTMSCKRIRMGKEEISKPSRFLLDIPSELMVKRNRLLG